LVRGRNGEWSDRDDLSPAQIAPRAEDIANHRVFLDRHQFQATQGGFKPPRADHDVDLFLAVSTLARERIPHHFEDGIPIVGLCNTNADTRVAVWRFLGGAHPVTR